MLAVTLATLGALAFAGAASAETSKPNTALINADSVTTFDEIEKEGTPISLEQFAAENAGYSVTVASGSEWEKMSAAEYAKYQVLIVGDPFCNVTAASAIKSAATWAPVVMGSSGQNTLVGNRALVGTDPEDHYRFGGGGAPPTNPADPTTSGAEHLVQDGITYAGAVPGATGVYFDTSCGDPGEEDVTSVLDKLTTTGPGHWSENGNPPCGGSVQQIAANPAFNSGPTKLLDSDIQGWECSDHVTFPAFPADWNALAVATDTATKPTCGTDPETKAEVCGQAYVLLAGEGLVVEAPNITLAPKTHSDPAGGSHTVTATVTKGETPVAGSVVTFVVSGQNSGVEGTCTTSTEAADPECKTDETGAVRFTYPDTNGAGNDTINASVTLDETTEHATASEEWTGADEEAEPTTLTTALSGAGQSGEKITVPEGTAVTDQGTLAGANASKATGTVSYKVYSDAECTKQVASQTVSVTGGGMPASEPVTLATEGVYYWTASYSGDGSNLASESKCGAEQVTVTKVEKSCSKVTGEGTFGEGKELQRVRNSLTTNLAMRHQKFRFYWEHGKKRFIMSELEWATCKVQKKAMVFRGRGEGRLNGVPEYLVSFMISVSSEETVKLIVKIRNEKTKEVVASFTDEPLEESTEEIS